MKRIDFKKCLGFGDYEGKCQNVAGTAFTPYWCPRCDALRRDAITAQLDAIAKSVGIEGTDCRGSADKKVDGRNEHIGQD